MKNNAVMENEIELRVRGVGAKFVSAVASGLASEIACFGARGDGKTISVLVGMIEHAQRHAESGFVLPVRWIGVRDTFASHRVNTIRSMQEPLWAGGWRFEDQQHMAIFRAGGVDLVRIDLFGIEDQGAMDRVRTACHCVWFEEVAPSALLVQSSGISESAWLLAQTSRRLPTHSHVSVITSNYPDEDHWSWRRFVTEESQGTMYFRIPPGERASAADRAGWERALMGRPDLLRRLLKGEPGSISMGVQVAAGFREDRHVSPVSLAPMNGEPLYLGWDGGHTPTVIIGQHWRGQVRVFSALAEERAGIRQLIQGQVIPWLSRHARYALEDRTMLLHGYDPSLNTDEQSDIDHSPVRVIEDLLGGDAAPGPVSWEARKGPLLSLLALSDAVVLDRVGCSALIKALSGRWYYSQDRLGAVSRDLPKKPNHPWEDLGDAFCYFLSRIAPTRTESVKEDRGEKDYNRNGDSGKSKSWMLA